MNYKVRTKTSESKQIAAQQEAIDVSRQSKMFVCRTTLDVHDKIDLAKDLKKSRTYAKKIIDFSKVVIEMS